MRRRAHDDGATGHCPGEECVSGESLGLTREITQTLSQATTVGFSFCFLLFAFPFVITGHW